MREKLQALIKESLLISWPDNAVDHEEVQKIIAAVRCENCRHWDFPSAVRPSGKCTLISKSWMNATHCDDSLYTAPDFYCAKFEGKGVALNVGEVSAELDHSAELPSTVG